MTNENSSFTTDKLYPMRYHIHLLSAVALLPALHAQNDWPVYDHDLTNQRYSTLSQINVNIAAKLGEAWSFNSNPNAGGGRAAARPGFGFEGTPLVVNDVMFIVTPAQSLVALEPETGKKVWELKHNHAGRPQFLANRETAIPPALARCRAPARGFCLPAGPLVQAGAKTRMLRLDGVDGCTAHR